MTTLRKLINDFDLCDIWRLRNPNIKRFTYRQKYTNCRSRFDFWLISNSLQKNIVSTEILPNIYSDHSAITLLFHTLSDRSKGMGYWKFNASLLKDEE